MRDLDVTERIEAIVSDMSLEEIFIALVERE